MTKNSPTPLTLTAATHTRAVVEWSDEAALREAGPDMLAALKAMLRCPGRHETDQETGETFATLINAAIAKAEGRGA